MQLPQRRRKAASSFPVAIICYIIGIKLLELTSVDSTTAADILRDITLVL